MGYLSKITAWSFSRWKDYEQCPAKAKYKHVLRMKEPSSPAMERGTAIHKMCEDYINGVLEHLPEELKKFEDSMNYLRTLKLENDALDLILTPVIGLEDSWTFKEDWTVTTWNDWISAWLRVKIDLNFSVEKGVLRIIDWKTGQYREDEVGQYMLQLELYALAALLTMPDIHTVIPKLAFIDHGVVHPIEDKKWVRDQLGSIKKSWLSRIAPMMNDTSFLPKPNSKCKWCCFSKTKGGPCKY